MTNTSSLPSLLSTPIYILVYSLPLLLVSVLLTFAGAFLTLDRTRSFPPYNAFDAQTRKRIWLLEGGVGGLLIGYAFGVHLSTFLSLLIPAVSSSSPLAPQSFLAVWILSVIPFTLLCGRWKYCTLTLSSVLGGSLLTLVFSEMINLPLLARSVITPIIIAILAIMILLPFLRCQHTFLRLAASITGSFGIVLSIALLAKISTWSNVWERFWLTDDRQGGTGKEKGMSTAFFFFLFAGIASDWVIKSKFGECPDQIWDQYLANYATNVSNRAGTFQPLRSFWDRILPFSRSNPKDIVATHGGLKQNDLLSSFSTRRHSPNLPYESISEDSLFRKPIVYEGRTRSPARFQSKLAKRKDIVKFKALRMKNAKEYSSDSDKEDAYKPPITSSEIIEASRYGNIDGGNYNEARRIRIEPTLKKTHAEDVIPDHSDDEDEVEGKFSELRPRFVLHCGSAAVKSGGHQVLTSSLAALPSEPSSHGAVHAMDRIIITQNATLESSVDCSTHTSLSSPGRLYAGQDLSPMRGGKWGQFWNDIRAKAMA